MTEFDSRVSCVPGYVCELGNGKTAKGQGTVTPPERRGGAIFGARYTF